MTNPTRRLAILGEAIGAVGVLWLLFGPVTTWLAGGDLGQLSVKDRIDAISGIHGQIGGVLSAAFVAGGLYYTGRKFFLDRDKQFTDRFNAAVGHLGASDVTVRAGGVRALDRIQHDSPLDRDRVLEQLSGFLRHHTRDGTSDAAVDRDDLSAAIAALRKPRRISRRVTEEPLDLRYVRLVGANLRGIRLHDALLTEADLTGAMLADADLTGARLDPTILRGVTATKACLRQASLRGAKVAGADLSEADCTATDFTEADLAGAILTGTILTDAVLAKTDLRGTDLSRVLGLAADQLRLAKADIRTRVPPGVDHPLHEPR